MATQTAKPTAATLIPSVQEYRDRFRGTPDHVIGSVTDAMSASLGVADGGGGSSVDIANGQALVQGTLYELSGGPLNLSTGATPSSDRIDIAVLTYDPTHDPIVYPQILFGTPGAGFPVMRSNPQGVFDLALGHWVKTSAGAITSMTDRRMFGDNHGRIMAKDATDGSGLGSGFVQGWFPSPERVGHEVIFWPSGNSWIWEGQNWAIKEGVFSATAVTTKNNTTNKIAIPGLAIPVAPNSRYSFDGFLHYSSPSNSTNIDIAWSYPTGTTMWYTSGGIHAGENNTVGAPEWKAVAQSTNSIYGTVAGNIQCTARINGTIITGSEYGIVSLSWGQKNATAETSTMYDDCYLRARRIA